MVFNSSSFFAFFLAVYLAYRLASRWPRAQNRLLLIASYVFYGYWDWRFPCLMAVTTIVDFLACAGQRAYPSRRRIWLGVSLVNNLGVLFLLKYFAFFQDNILVSLQQLGIEASPILTSVILPVGISFYTFQRLTFVIDVYQGKETENAGFLDFALFVSFFPLLLSGPIERARSLLPQLLKPRAITSLHVEEGVWLIAWGLFKKVFIADNLAGIVNPVFAPGWDGTGAEALVAVYAYAFQIYCDFSGYSDVARGLARLLGFDVMVNFNLPYMAVNPSDFWRRWHISLSTWLRDYVYIPLGGNRHGAWVTNRNLMVTMILVGLWHGAAWTFVLWGVYHGTLLIGNRLISKNGRESAEQKAWYHRPVSIVLMFHATCLGWLLFRAESVHQAVTLAKTIVTDLTFSGMVEASLVSLVGYISVLLLVQWVQAIRGEALVLKGVPVAVKGMAYGVLFYFTLLHGGTSDSFIYFQF